MQKACDHTGDHAGEEGCQQRQLGVDAGEHQHDAHRAAGGHTAVHRQVGHAQHPEGHENAQRQNAPNQALGHTTGQGTHQR